MAKESKCFFQAIHVVFGMIIVTLVCEAVYLHCKSMSLEERVASLVQLQRSTAMELEKLSKAGKIKVALSNEMTRREWREEEDSDALMPHRRKRSLENRAGNATENSVTNTVNGPVGESNRSKNILNTTIGPNEVELGLYEENSLPKKVVGQIIPKKISSAEKTNISSTVEKTDIVELNFSSLYENEGDRSIRIEQCKSTKKGLHMDIKLKIENDGVCHCVAAKRRSKSDHTNITAPLAHPRVSLSASRIKGAIGKPIEVHCNITGSSITEVAWKKISGNISGEQHVENENHSLILRINNPAMEDNGIYACSARNNAGIDEKTVQLTFVEKECSSWKQKGHSQSGIYTISPDGRASFEVFCDMDTDGGGWNVIQRRQDGGEDFYRKWVDYKNGFGNITGEFWLGNDKIHRLTDTIHMSVRFDLRDSKGRDAYAEYDIFHIGDEKDHYRLNVGWYVGTAGDSFSYHSGMRFSTKDSNYNIFFGKSCAKRFRGAWWFRACHRSNLNGEYNVGPTASIAEGIKWMTFSSGPGSLARTEIKLRPLKDQNKSYMK